MCACGGYSHTHSPDITCRAPFSVFVHLLSLCALLVQGPCSASCVPVSEFFPFGNNSNDMTTERSDDGGSGRINLTVMFPFFGKRHDKLYVNNNGVISFFDELRTYRPEKFPLNDTIPIIAPYWADVDISTSNGTVFYRETQSGAILAKATNEIRIFPAYRNFQAYWVFVATWNEVGFFGASGDGLNKKNTFQAVLALDALGRQSFVILNYAKIEWTTGSNSLGDTSTGLGGYPAQAGFNAGDRVNAFEIEGARASSVINLTQTSNMGVPGKWIFRIDSSAIQNVCSQEESGQVSFQPTFTSMLGGDPVLVSGLCSDSDVPSVEGRLELEDGLSEELCCFIADSSAQCHLPPVFMTGFVNISLNIGGRGWNYSGELEIKNIVDTVTSVIRVNPDNWELGKRVTVSWKFGFLEDAENYSIEILAFKIMNGSSNLYTMSNTTREKHESRNYEIVLPHDFSGATIAVVRVTALPNNCSSLVGPSIYSDVFPVKYTDVSYSQTMCSSWLSEQVKLKPLEVPGRCPCTLRQAEGDTAQYMQDPFCSNSQVWEQNCRYRSRSASQCIIPNQISEEIGTFVCCYDKDSGELLIALEGRGGGTMERYHFRQSGPSVIPYFTYMQEEIAPYLHCCEFSNSSKLCDQYLKFRQPVDCRGYQPPAAAQAAGDPHIVTLDNYAYTFNGVGEFTLLRIKETQATVQVKAVPVRDIKNQLQNATVFSAVAMKASNSSSTLEIRLRTPGEQELVSVYKDSELFPLSTTTSQLSEMTVYKNGSQEWNGTLELTIVMVDLGLSVLVQATEEMLNIMVMAGSKLKSRLEGLLGNYNDDSTDDLTASDGTVLSVNATMREVHNKFGMSWAVSKNDSLFMEAETSAFDKNSNDETVHNYKAVFIDELQDYEFPNDTERLCDGNPQCRYDYTLTEMESIAVTTLKFSKRYEERKQDIKEVVRCPYLGADAIANGNRNLSGREVGNVAVVECNDGYTMNGSGTLVCSENGEWNSSPPSCVRVISDASLPVTLAIGAAAGGFVLVVVTILVIRIIYKKCSSPKLPKSVLGSEMENTIDLPRIFPISDIPTPVFENSLFMSSLNKLSEKGSFQIPRPTFVDPNIYSEYF